MSTPEQKKLFRKHKITARKHGGDDMYSWAVFQGTHVCISGISRDQVDYYKCSVLKRIIEQQGATS